VSRSIEYSPESGNVYARRRFEIREIHFDRRYPNEFFWPDIQPGTMVFDTIRKRDYRQPGEPAAEVVEASSPGSSPAGEGRPSAARPLRADRGWPGWTTILSAIAILGGAALVLVALVKRFAPPSSGA
jgi:hypothetical protein